MVLRQPEEEYQSLEMKYESVSSFRLQRDKKNNNLKYTTHSTLLCFFFFLKEKKCYHLPICHKTFLLESEEQISCGDKEGIRN